MDSAGKTVTAAQAEQEYRKQMIVAGRPLEGEEYDRGLDEWYGTYRKLTRSDKRSIGATTIVMAVGFAVAALVAFVALFSGGGLLAFVLILLIGGFLSFGLGMIVMIFTSLGKSN